MAIKLSEHFTLEELTTTTRAKYAEANRQAGIANVSKLKALAQFAESIREVLDVPLTVTSGYRCLELNAAIGGSASSQHCRFEAFDFVPIGLWVREAFMKLKNSTVSFGQLILERRGESFIIHAGMGNKRELLYSSRQGKYEKFIEEQK